MTFTAIKKKKVLSTSFTRYSSLYISLAKNTIHVHLPNHNVLNIFCPLLFSEKSNISYYGKLINLFAGGRKWLHDGTALVGYTVSAKLNLQLLWKVF